MNAMKSKIKVKHTATASVEVIDSMFNAIVACVKTPYPTLELEAEAMKVAKDAFASEVHAIVAQAFRTGKKIGKFKADSKDTEMYSDGVPLPYESIPVY